MNFSDLQKKEFQEAAAPLIDWLSANADPHTTVIVTLYGAEVSQGIFNFITEEHLGDYDIGDGAENVGGNNPNQGVLL